jgi:hypothetical protein
MNVFKEILEKAIQEGHGSIQESTDRVVRAIFGLPYWEAQNVIDESLGTGAFTSIVKDVAHNRLMKGFMGVPADWRKVVSDVVSCEDLKERTVTIFSGTPVLPDKNEHEGFEEVTPTDDEETYTPTEKGRIFSITMNARANDQIGAFNKWAEREGKAATNTINKAIFYTNLDANPTMRDSNSLIDTTNHSNLATAALSRANLETGIGLMLAQTGEAGEKIMAMPRYIVTHPDILLTAIDLTSREVRLGATVAVTGEPNALGPGGMFALEAFPSSWISTTKDAYLIADPASHPTFEIAFLNGRENPEILQEAAGTGAAFTHNVIRFRTQMVFGAKVLDWRGIVHLNAA